jgi:FtsH-binding integral membrane protein
MASGSFIPIVYLHLLGGTAVTFASSGYPLAKSLLYTIGMAIASLLLIFILLAQSPGPLKYGVALIYCAVIGQLMSSLVKKLEHKELLVQVMASVLGIFLGMSVIGFLDNQNILGFGGYLVAGLLGLLVARIGLLVAYGVGADASSISSVNKILSWIGTALFAVFVAYDTQLLKKEAKSLKKPDYVNSSLGLYLDIINLFSDVGNLMGGE